MNGACKMIGVTLVMYCASLVMISGSHAQEPDKLKHGTSTSPAADASFQAAKRYLLDNQLATEERIERAVKNHGKESVVRYARGKGFKGTSGNVPDKSARPRREPNCDQTQVGFIPLNDLGSRSHKDAQGGLYPDGMNVPPEQHLKMGLKLASQVVLLNKQGQPDQEHGKIVLLAIGMSNTTQEFRVFKQLADADPRKNSRLVVVDGAQGGQSADRTATPDARFWTVIDQRLALSGVSAMQVQTAWVKQATPGPNLPFPQEPNKLREHLKTNLHIMQKRYPNLKLVYLSSRIYAGYASTRLNPEPHAYETAFAVKWLIEDQISGQADLNCNPEDGEVKTPWLAWGPYLWADGLQPRSDGLIWKCEEFASDGTHPGTAARQKVAEMLLKFFATDPTSKPWFLKPSARLESS